MSKYYLGIDTSNYKTSIALTDVNNNLILQFSDFLNVKSGSKGLRQSEAFFQHSIRLPEYIERLFNEINSSDISAIGVSSRPRRIEGSYMPCFLAGVNLARELSSALNIPIHYFSHQEGHAAAILENNDSISERNNCLFFHLSGGTSEFLLCQRDEHGYSMKIVGGTKDISIGQLFDRIGVSLDFPFPAGKYIDKIATESIPSSGNIPQIKSSNCYFNLSGLENSFSRYKNNKTQIEINRTLSELFIRISDLLFRSAVELSDKHHVNDVYIAGGVASSDTIRKNINSLVHKHNSSNLNINFAEKELCGDNAVGIARLASRYYR